MSERELARRVLELERALEQLKGRSGGFAGLLRELTDGGVTSLHEHNPYDVHPFGLVGTDDAWHALNFLFGYHDRYAEFYREQKAGAGTYVKAFTAVPSGYVYIVQCMWLMNETTANCTAAPAVRLGANLHYLGRSAALAVWEASAYTDEIPLKAADYLEPSLLNCADGDWIQCGAFGYKMRVDL